MKTISDIEAAYENACAIYSVLNESQLKMAELDSIMENISFSIDVIKSHGTQAVDVLNADKSLECLMAVPADMIKVDNAVEALSDKLREIWKTFKEWCIKIFNSILDMFKKVFPNKLSKLDELNQKIKETPDNAGATEALDINDNTLYQLVDAVLDNSELLQKAFSEVYGVSSQVHAVVKASSSSGASVEETHKQLQAIVFNNDSKFFKAQDKLEKVEEFVSSFSIGEIQKLNIDSAKKISDRCVAISKKLLVPYVATCEKGISQMKPLLNSLESLNVGDDYTNLLITAYRNIIKDMSKMAIMADRIMSILLKVNVAILNGIMK